MADTSGAGSSAEPMMVVFTGPGSDAAMPAPEASFALTDLLLPLWMLLRMALNAVDGMLVQPISADDGEQLALSH